MTHQEYPGKLIVVDGLDCAGKSSVIVPSIKKWFDDHGIPAIAVADMNTTEYSKAIRGIFLGEVGRNVEITSLIMLSCSARRELIQTVIRPALEKGIHVICDRFASTTYVFGEGAKSMRQLLDLSLDGIRPDYTFMCTLDWDDFVLRQQGRGISKDRFEEAGREKFEHRKLRYFEYFEMMHANVTTLNTSESKEEVQNEINQMLKHVFIKQRHYVH